MVLAGGLSEEREVSLASSRAITEALIGLGYHVSAIDSADGRSLLDDEGHFLLKKDDNAHIIIGLRQSGCTALAESINSEKFNNIDIVFLGLHGGAGEDGTIQALLNLAGKKHTGSGVLASAVAMNKAFAKKVVNTEGVPTPKWLLFRLTAVNNLKDIIEKIMNNFEFPIIVKPNNSGSTIGLTLVKQSEGLHEALKKAGEVSKEILIEEYIKGREITAAVLNGEPLPLVEIIPTNELYDYQCKYTKGKSRYVCPAEIPENIAIIIQELAGKTYKAIGCAGLARVDFILNTNGNPYFLEVNTLPGMTELSLAPMAAKAAGISFAQLVERICQSALEK